MSCSTVGSSSNMLIPRGMTARERFHLTFAHANKDKASLIIRSGHPVPFEISVSDLSKTFDDCINCNKMMRKIQYFAYANPGIICLVNCGKLMVQYSRITPRRVETIIFAQPRV